MPFFGMFLCCCHGFSDIVGIVGMLVVSIKSFSQICGEFSFPSVKQREDKKTCLVRPRSLGGREQRARVGGGHGKKL